MIDINSISGDLLLSVPVLADSVSHEELMISDYVQLSWRSDRGDKLPNGSYIEHNGERYSLVEDYCPSRVNEVEYRYIPQFHSRIIRWQKSIVPVYTYASDGVTVKTRELDWDFTGTPSDAMYIIQQAILNETGEKWTISMGDDLPETVSLHSESSSIWSMLSELAELCETEWWADKESNILHLDKCKHGTRIEFEVGSNIGVPSTTSSNEGYFTRFYAFGSTRNVTQSESAVQGSFVNKRLTLSPTKYPEGYKDIKGHFENGVFVSDLSPEEVYAMPIYFDDVYPSSRLTISDVRKRMRYYLDDDNKKIIIGGTEENPIYDQYAIWYFKIDGIEFSEDLLIDNLPLSVVFKSGRLRGREFELVYHSVDKKVADAADVDKEFSVSAGDYEIIFDDQSVSGMVIPDDSYIIPSEGDEVTLFNIEMPSEYTASAWDELEAKLDEEIERRTKDNKSYEFASNPVAFNDSGTSVHVGQPVTFLNGDSSLDTRVLMVESHLDYSFDKKIRIGNEVIKGTRQQLKDEVKNIGSDIERMADNAYIQSVNYTKRTWRNAKETLSMLQAAMTNFSQGINPVTVETMSMLVGDERLQFVFTEAIDSDVEADFTYTYIPRKEGEENKNEITFVDSFIKHMTLGIDSISPVHADEEYKRWAVIGGPQTLENDKAYYLYAVVSKTSQSGSFLASTDVLNDTDEDYYLLVGILNTPIDGERSFARMYGYTEVRPGQIVTEEIRSSDGKTFLDLVKGILHLNDMAGVSGVKTEEKGDKSIAAWFGGLMEDMELDEETTNPAKSVIRHDGTGYFAKGLFTWDDSTGINLGNDGIKLNYDGSIEFGNDIKIGVDGEETLGTILTLLTEMKDMFYRYDDNTIGTKYNLFSEREVSANGLSLGSGSGSGTGGGLIQNVLGTSSFGSVTSEDNSTTFNAYAIDSLYKRIVSLEANSEDDGVSVDLTNYYTKAEADEKITSSLAPYIKEEDANLKYALLAEFSELKSDFDALNKALSDDVSGKINTWNEIVDFVDEYSGNEDLETILTGINTEVNKRLLTSTYDTFISEKYTPLETKVGGFDDSITELQNKVVDLEQFEQATNTALLDLQGKDESLMADIEVLATQAGAYETQIGELNTRVETAEGKISTNAANIEKFLEWFDVDAEGNLYTTYNLYSTKEISANGMSLGAGGGSTGGGIITSVLGTSSFGSVASDDNSTTFNAYAIDSLYNRIVVLEGKDVEVDLSDYYTKQQTHNVIDTIIAPYLKTTDADTKYAPLEGFNTLKSDFDALNKALNDDVSGKINTWNEIVDFVDEYSGSEDLETILAGINTEVNNRLLISTYEAFLADRFNPLEETVDGIGSRIAAVEKILDWFDLDSEGNLYTTLNLYSAGEISANGLGQGNGGSGGGLITSVLGTSSFGSVSSEDNSTTFNAYAIDSLYKRIVALEENGGDVDLSAYYTKTETDAAITSALSPYFKTASFTKANIKSTLGISDWALTSSKPSYAWSEITSKPSFATVATSGSYNDLSNKPTIPSSVTESTVSGWGFTKNAGTVTGVTINGSTKSPSNGIVNLGTVITAHQDISGKVDKVSGKGLSTNDYTTTEKNKLSGIAAGAEVNVQADWSVTNSASDAYIKNKPTIPSAVTESTVSGWGFTKNTGTYSKPSTGIPKSDLASAVQTSLGKADTALQSYTEKYTGTITGIKMNGSSKGTSGVVDLGTVLTSHQTIYALTIKNSGGTTETTYTPNSSSASITLTKSMVGLGSVENTALSSWTGSTKITTLGTISSGKWQGTAIANSYLANSSMTIAGNSVSLGGTLTATTLRNSIMGSTALGGTSTYLYWTGSSWGTKALGTFAFKSSLVASDIPTLSGYLSTSGGTVSGPLTVGGTLAPDATGTRNLGTSLKYWNYCYALYGRFSTDVMIGSAKLSWDGTNSALKVNYPFYSTGEISANGLYTSSDVRFKNKIEDTILDVNTIADAPIFKYTWNNVEDGKVHIGSSAQYWREHARELVTVDNTDFHRLDYATLGVMMGVSLAKEVKALKKEIEGLKEENRILRYGN